MAECGEILRGSSDDNGEKLKKLKICCAAFNETMNTVICEAADSFGEFPSFAVTKADGDFYSTTSFTCLYEGIGGFESDFAEYSVYFFLITDGKPSDAEEYSAAANKTASGRFFLNTERYVLYPEETCVPVSERYMNEFTSGRPDRIIQLSGLPGVISGVLSELL